MDHPAWLHGPGEKARNDNFGGLGVQKRAQTAVLPSAVCTSGRNSASSAHVWPSPAEFSYTEPKLVCRPRFGQCEIQSWLSEFRQDASHCPWLRTRLRHQLPCQTLHVSLAGKVFDELASVHQYFLQHATSGEHLLLRGHDFGKDLLHLRKLKNSAIGKHFQKSRCCFLTVVD